jgi:hypothetical protein
MSEPDCAIVREALSGQALAAEVEHLARAMREGCGPS